MKTEAVQTFNRPSLHWLVLAAMCLMLQSHSHAAVMALLLQQTPVDGGTVEPGTGVHRLESNSQITLRAVPKAGYQFVMWLGDVDEPSSPATEAYMDSPKIVIAVFERSEYESIEAADLLAGGPGGGGLRASAADISSGAGGGGGAKRPSHPGAPITPSQEEEPEYDELIGPGDALPGPGDGEVPEPATVLLFAAGLVIVMRRRKLLKDHRPGAWEAGCKVWRR